MIYYIIGGERSGKSSYAQNLAEKLSSSPYYLATSRILDDDFQKRVDRHISERDEKWITLEEEKNLSNVIPVNSVVVVDCITLWLTNLYTDSKYDVDIALFLARNEIDRFLKIDTTLIIISNEIGMGIHANTKSGRKFTQLQGWVNQYIATKSDKAIFMISGLPLNLK